MKIPTAFVTLLAVALALPALADGVVRLSEPVEVGDGYEVFGSPMTESGEPVALSQVVAESEAYAGKQVKVKAKVAQVCQKKGCFLVAHDGDAVARVTFVDYSFFVPTDSGGKDVTVVGTFNRRTITEAQARHFAEDVGDDPSKIVGPRDEYFIVATSVVVPTS